jgi:hypothetical protein
VALQQVTTKKFISCEFITAFENKNLNIADGFRILRMDFAVCPRFTNGKSLLHPLSYGGGLPNPLKYETVYSTP